MSAIPWQLFDRCHIEFIEEQAKKKKLRMVVCGFIPFFRDDIMDSCSKCKGIIYIRPRIQDVAKRYNVPIVCLNCANKREVASATVEALERVIEKIKMGEKE